MIPLVMRKDLAYLTSTSESYGRQAGIQASKLKNEIIASGFNFFNFTTGCCYIFTWFNISAVLL